MSDRPNTLLHMSAAKRSHKAKISRFLRQFELRLTDFFVALVSVLQAQLRQFESNADRMFDRDDVIISPLPPPLCVCVCVAGSIDRRQFESNADRMFDWDDVILVDMMSATPIQCPISLESPPLCPQITPCGHVYSFGSIMQHLMTHGGEQLRRSAPCPLCYQPVVARELRLVTVSTGDGVKVTCRIGMVFVELSLV